MADSADLGVVDHRCEAFGYEGLLCMDSSAIPTSLGVNLSLTISAVCERAASELVAARRPLGCRRRLPASPPRTPDEIVGDRVVAPDNDPSTPSVRLLPRPAARARFRPGDGSGASDATSAAANAVRWSGSLGSSPVTDDDPPRSTCARSGVFDPAEHRPPEPRQER
jgi:hypothetical protein